MTRQLEVVDLAEYISFHCALHTEPFCSGFRLLKQTARTMMVVKARTIKATLSAVDMDGVSGFMAPVAMTAATEAFCSSAGV
jgi:hypothetical protein